MSKVFNEVIDRAKFIREERLEGKNWIYVDKNLRVYLIEELPEEYWIKGDILIVDNPEQYLYEINKRKASDKELKDFLWISYDQPKIDETIYGDVIPSELIREQLLKLPVGDILKNRRTSKEFKDVIDKNEFWCNVFERDYPDVEYDKNDCLNEYKNIYKYAKISLEQIQDAAEKYGVADQDIIKYIEMFNAFKRKGNIWYYDPYKHLSRIFGNIIQNKKRDKINLIDIPSYMGYLIHNRKMWDNAQSYARNVYKAISYILPKEINISKDGGYYITYKNYVDYYNKVYGNSFDKDFINELPIFLKEAQLVKRKTPQQFLAQFYETFK